MEATQNILSFQSVTISSDENYDSGIWRMTLALAPGELALIKLEARQHLPIADAAAGLAAPQDGTVSFQGVDWQNMQPRAAAEARADRSRHLTASGGSATSMSMKTSCSRYVTIPTLLCRTCTIRRQSYRGFSKCRGFCATCPNIARKSDLRRAACVRAFLGEPMLLILEQPERDVFPDIMPPLLASIRSRAIAARLCSG